MTQTPRIDSWSGLSHRPVLDPTSPKAGDLAPSWVGPKDSTDVRRLTAYTVLAALIENSSRTFLQDATRMRESREYGDAALIRDAVLAALLGDDLTVQVEGADVDKPEKPTPEDAAEDDEQDPGDEEDAEDGEPDTFAEDLADWQRATDRQAWIDENWSLERAPLKIHETERNAVGLGDGVYLLSWSGEKKRCRLRIYDPGFYFPVLGDDSDDDYPDRAHLAWEFTDANGAPSVRRITYERVEIAEAQARGVLVEGTKASAAGVEDEATITKVYPYAEADEDPSEYVTLMTDATWRIQDLHHIDNVPGVDTFDSTGAVYAQNADGQQVRDLDLGIDFIPLVHVPNTVALLDHYGVSVLTRVCQILDDLAGTDTDLQVASSITGAPPLSIDGPNMPGQIEQAIYGPGTVFKGGKITVADTSKSLDALLKLAESLLKRLSVNGRVPEEVLGRVKAGDISSGVQLALSFGPFRSLINELRLVRADKYRLLFKLWQRFAINAGAQGVKGKGILPADAKPLDIDLVFGSYMPNDVSAAKDLVVGLVGAHLMARATGIKILEGLGVDYPTEIDEEVEQIEREDFEGAYRLAEATGSEQRASEYLHLPVDPNAAPLGKAPAPPHPTPAASGTPAPANGPPQPTVVPAGASPAPAAPGG